MYKIDYKAIMTQWDLIAIAFLENQAKQAQKDVKTFTPEDTWDLEENIDIWATLKTPLGYSKEIFTDLSKVEYAWIVEDWVDGKKYQYHKPKWVPFWEKRQGAKMYEQVYYKYQTILWKM